MRQMVVAIIRFLLVHFRRISAEDWRIKSAAITACALAAIVWATWIIWDTWNSLTEYPAVLSDCATATATWVDAVGCSLATSLALAARIFFRVGECGLACALEARLEGLADRVRSEHRAPRVAVDPRIATARVEPAEQGKHCLVCLAFRAAVAALPCGHLLYCPNCAPRTVAAFPKCLLCSKDVTAVTMIY